MEQYANNPTTTLTAAITSTSATSLTVASAGAFPSAGNFRILIDGEILKVTAVSGTTWTIARGDGGSIAATHLNGASVFQILTAESLNALVTVQVAGTAVSDRRVINFVSGATASDNSGSGRCDITISTPPGLTYGAGASRPSAGTAGRIYVPSDGAITSIDTGSAWVGHNPFGISFTIPPAKASWTAISDGTNGVCSDIPGGGLFFSGNSGYSALYKTLGSGTSYTVTAAVSCQSVNNGFPHFGMFVSDGSKIIGFGLDPTTGNDELVVTEFSNFSFEFGSGTGVTTVYNKVVVSGGNAPLWLRMTNNGTSRFYYTSMDGINFVQLFSHTFNTFISETLAGVYVAGGNTPTTNNGTAAMNVWSWSGA